jgi:chaperone required for assembly of F1-ATPase
VYNLRLTRSGAEATLRRFWKTVNIQEEEGGYIVQLDRRNLRTPGGKKLVIPAERRLLAALIAHEWDIQEEVLKQHALPMVRCSPCHSDRGCLWIRALVDPLLMGGLPLTEMRY